MWFSHICRFLELRVGSSMFLLKKTIKKSLLRPLWDPPMLTIEEVKKLIKHSIFKLLAILVLSKTSSIGQSTEPFFNDFSRAFLVKPWGEFDGNHCCFFIISKTALLENNEFSRWKRLLLDLILGTPIAQFWWKKLRNFNYFAVVKRSIFWWCFREVPKTRFWNNAY